MDINTTTYTKKRNRAAALATYDPNNLLDVLLEMLQVKNDLILSRMLDVPAPSISRIRHHKLAVGASMLIRMHEISGLSINRLRVLMGDHRDKFYGK